MKEWTGAYVAHECKKCGKAFIAEDYTNAKSLMPTWRYCQICAKEKGINYSSQTPKLNRTPEENERYKKLGEIGKQNIKKSIYRNQK